jgi:outer membrane protein OmpA-like peptidoglycan-associated protein/tetratricopeptide (TPR) repeat protein
MMKHRYIISLFIFMLMIPFTAYPQKYHTSSSRAVRAYSSGKQNYEYLFFDLAEKELKEAISLDRNFYEAYIVLGEMLSKLKRYSEAARYYSEAVRIDSLYYKPVYFPLANAEMMSGDYIDALTHFKTYLEQNTGSENNRIQAERNIRDCEFGIIAVRNPVPFNPENLGDSVNTPDDEYWPSITADGMTLMFTRQERGNVPNNRNQEDFYISRLRDNAWSKAYNAGRPLNTFQNEGAQSISSDGSYMFFTACDRPGGFGRCDIYFSSFDGRRWSEASNIGAPVNTRYWESQPSISSNGKMLFFSSNRPGGHGGMDIWYSIASEDGKWAMPKNLGPVINSPGDEMSPFIHFDGRTLYFSSNGRVGLGGFDMYVSRMNEDTTWNEPENLGYPINTYSDELGLIIDATGQNAYFSSIRDPRKGKDIFYFTLYESVRPDPVSYLKGTVYDSETMQLLKADYELISLKTGLVASSGSTNTFGSFLVCIPTGLNYGLNVNKQGYLFYSDNFMLEGTHSVTEPYIKNILLNPIEVGKTMQLSNVFYEFDSWEIKKESFAELDRLYRLLRDNPGIIVEVAGYTDSIGTPEYNQVLSEKRAMSVVNFLVVKGIRSDRLKFKGYGASSPIGNNITDAGRRLNRRTEVRVISKK